MTINEDFMVQEWVWVLSIEIQQVRSIFQQNVMLGCFGRATTRRVFVWFTQNDYFLNCSIIVELDKMSTVSSFEWKIGNFWYFWVSKNLFVQFQGPTPWNQPAGSMKNGTFCWPGRVILGDLNLVGGRVRYQKIGIYQVHLGWCQLTWSHLQEAIYKNSFWYRSRYSPLCISERFLMKRTLGARIEV